MELNIQVYDCGTFSRDTQDEIIAFISEDHTTPLGAVFNSEFAFSSMLYYEDKLAGVAIGCFESMHINTRSIFSIWRTR